MPKFCMHLSFKKYDQTRGPDFFSFVTIELISCTEVMANINYYFSFTAYSHLIQLLFFLVHVTFLISLMTLSLMCICYSCVCIYITRMLPVTIKQIFITMRLTNTITTFGSDRPSMPKEQKLSADGINWTGRNPSPAHMCHPDLHSL